jgi:hypothetical protein
MAQTFSAQVSAFVAKTERRIEAVFKASAQDVISDMQEPGPAIGSPTAFGTGNLPVVTGFLRASLQAAINNPPGGITFRPPDGNFAYEPSAVALVIAGARLGETIYATYAANYAPFMEARYGFVRLAAQNWQSIVDRNAREAQRRVLG